MSDDFEGIYDEYKREAQEILRKMRSSCENLKERPDKHALTEIVQCSHKIKGVAGMMDYSHIAELAKEMEFISKLLVEGKLQSKPDIIALLLESTNLLAKYIETGFDERDTTLLQKLRKLSNM